MDKSISLLRSTVHIGLEKPFRFLHLTDSHICLDDEGMTSGRQAWVHQKFENCELEYFRAFCAHAKREGLPIVHTGDLYDFQSRPAFAFTDEHLAPLDYFFAAGNHDFMDTWPPVGCDKRGYKTRNIPHVAPHIKDNLLFASRIWGGVNFVSLDNSFYKVTEGQIALLRAEVAKGYPVVLCMHIPFFTEEHAQKLYEEAAWYTVGQPSCFLLGIPEEHLRLYKEEHRRAQTCDKTTLRFIDYVKSESRIKLIVAGHTHDNFEEILPTGQVQITTHGTYYGFGREITLT